MRTFIIFLFFFITISSYSQNTEVKDVDSYKIAFITERLDLSSEEAQKFWPIYNKHHKLFEELKNKEWSPIKKGLNEIDNLSDQEAEKLLEDYRNYKQKRVDYRENFIKELLTIISPKKIMLLKKADYDFNRELLKQYSSN